MISVTSAEINTLKIRRCLWKISYLAMCRLISHCEMVCSGISWVLSSAVVAALLSMMTKFYRTIWILLWWPQPLKVKMTSNLDWLIVRGIDPEQQKVPFLQPVFFPFSALFHLITKLVQHYSYSGDISCMHYAYGNRYDIYLLTCPWDNCAKHRSAKLICGDSTMVYFGPNCCMPLSLIYFYEYMLQTFGKTLNIA